MRIFGALSDRQGPGHWRLAVPLTELANRGHEVWIDGGIHRWVAENLEGGVDVLVGQRISNVEESNRWQRMAREGHTKLVYEIDDDLWRMEADNPSFKFFDGDHARRASAFLDDGVQRRMTENIRVADVVTVSTEPLAELVSQWNRNVHICPNMIPASMLDRAMPQQQTERVTIGWAGSPTHDRDFGEVAKPLKRVLQRFGDAVEFHCMGADYTPRVSSHKGHTRYTDWVPGVGAYLENVDFRIGIAPLRESIFNTSKSDLKLLELAAMGIPAAVSYTGPYARAIDAGAPARFAQDHKTWERELVALVQSPADRETLGKEAREWAATRTIESQAWRWEEAYQS